MLKPYVFSRLVKFLGPLLLAAMTGGCVVEQLRSPPALAENDGGNPTMDGGRSDGGNPVPRDVGTMARADVAMVPLNDAGQPPQRDVGLDAGGPDAADPAIDAGPPCLCKVAGDECAAGVRPDEAVTCVMGGQECNPVETCPESYECQDARCVCSNPVVCGMPCEQDAQCPDLYVDGQTCDVATNTCRRDFRLCLRDSMCQAGDICVRDTHNESCQPAGPLENNAPCERNEDCSSLLCDSICLSRCETNADCGQGLRCVRFLGEGAWTLACVAPANSPCVEAGRDCDAPNQLCYGDNCVETGECEDGTDCEGDCQLRGGESLLILACRPPPKRCADTEFTVQNSAGRPGYCVLPRACEVVQDCPDGYDCLLAAPIASFIDSSNRGRVGLCARTQPD